MEFGKLLPETQIDSPEKLRLAGMPNPKGKLVETVKVNLLTKPSRWSGPRLNGADSQGILMAVTCS
jgi:hypothetical protein